MKCAKAGSIPNENADTFQNSDIAHASAVVSETPWSQDVDSGLKSPLFSVFRFLGLIWTYFYY